VISHHYINRQEQSSNAITAAWQVEGMTAFQQEKIIPKGVVEIIFNFSEGKQAGANINNKHFSIPACFINGLNTLPIKVGLPEKQLYFGVQLQPLAVKKLLGIPAGEFADSIIDLTLIDSTYLSLWQQPSGPRSTGTKSQIQVPKPHHCRRAG